MRVLRKVLANNLALSDAEDNTFESVNRGVIADLPLFWQFAKSLESQVSGK